MVFGGLIRAVLRLFRRAAPQAKREEDPCRGCRWRRAGEKCVLPSCFRQKEEREWNKGGKGR